MNRTARRLLCLEVLEDRMAPSALPLGNVEVNPQPFCVGGNSHPPQPICRDAMTTRSPSAWDAVSTSSRYRPEENLSCNARGLSCVPF
jgi:hypothetical protein